MGVNVFLKLFSNLISKLILFFFLIILLTLFFHPTAQAYENQTHETQVFSAFATPSSLPHQIVEDVILKLGPTRSQGNTETCTANAVADAATLLTGQRISTFSILIRHFQKRKGLDYAFLNPLSSVGGNFGMGSRYKVMLAASVLESTLDTTLCGDDQSPYSINYTDGDLKSLWTDYHQFRSYFGPTAPLQLFSQIETQLKKVSPSLPSKDFMSRLNPSLPLDVALGEWFDRNCQIPVLPSSWLKVMGSKIKKISPEQIVASIDRALEKKSIAVIHYDSALLKGVQKSVWQSFIGFHVSSIVAKIKKETESLYLLRNSWGTGCSGYSADIQKRCDLGHIWIKDSEIRNYVTSVAYYSPEK